MNLFQVLLKQAQEENKPAAFRINASDGPRLYLGYLLDYNEDTISVRSLSTQGLPNGILVFKTADLFGIDYNDIYLRRLEAKEANLRKLYANTTVPALFHIGNCSMDEILLQAQKEAQLIYVNLYQDLGLFGYIKELTETEFLIETYNSFGQYDGLSVHLLENIRNINWDDEDTRIVKILVESNFPQG